MGYFALTIITFLSLLLGYIILKNEWAEDLSATFFMIGSGSLVYWLLITTAIITYGIKKYIEIGDFQLFIKLLRG